MISVLLCSFNYREIYRFPNLIQILQTKAFDEDSSGSDSIRHNVGALLCQRMICC